VHSGGVSPTRPNRHARVELFRKHWDFLAAAKPVDAITSEPLSEVKAAFRRLTQHLPPIVVEVLGDGKSRALGTVVGSDGRILTKASELYGAISCRFADGQIRPATVQKVSREHDLAVLQVDARDLPEAKWSQSETIPPGTLIAAPVPGKPPLVGVVSLTARQIPPETGWLGVGLRDSDRGLEVEDDEMADEFDVPIHKGDIIVHVEGQPTPDHKKYLELMDEVGVPPAYAGDPVRVGVKRGDKTLEFRFPLVPSAFMIPYHRPEYESLRWSALPSAFDSDVPLTPKTCGGPVIDRSGRVAGIAIASRGQPSMSLDMILGRIYVIPASVAKGVVAE
jgi:S1-C subfamily serine protease